MADQFFTIKAKVESHERRKAWINGTIESVTQEPDEKSVVFADAKALFIAPKNAEMFKV